MPEAGADSSPIPQCSSHESPCAAQLRLGLACLLRQSSKGRRLLARRLQPHVATAGDDEDDAAHDRGDVGHLGEDDEPEEARPEKERVSERLNLRYRGTVGLVAGLVAAVRMPSQPWPEYAGVRRH